MPKFDRIVLLSDGIRGHYHQSLGIAQWLERLGGGRLDPPVNVPHYSGLQKLMKMKLFVHGLAVHGGAFSREWLNASGLRLPPVKPNTLFISAGSSAAPFCLACAKASGNKSAVVMTPSVLGTKPFDYAIIPEHDKHDPKDTNILTTLGAPNHIWPPELAKVGENFFADRDFGGKKIVAVLVGGSDANYKPSPKWAEDALGSLRYIDGIKILLTTSRRTGDAVDSKIEEMFANDPSLGFMLILSKKPRVNALTAMLGKATHVLVTEDSVSMVSEAVTAGFRVGLLRVPRVAHPLKNALGFGVKRFDDLFERMRQKNLLVDLGEMPDFRKFLEPSEQKHNTDFNEAKRAAEWILSKP
ncbi:MAG: mitochondrial fission ELM1 family protein [Synergistaceae bacterium]|nr:mitochondrial fission ELM1 family protein [Synergistaceae bacterium]